MIGYAASGSSSAVERQLPKSVLSNKTNNLRVLRRTAKSLKARDGRDRVRVLMRVYELPDMSNC